MPRENRRFLQRGTRWLTHSGIDQFLDIGTGLPTAGNVHEIAQDVNSAVRVVYVDYDPIALVHVRALLGGSPQGRTAYLDADVRDPAGILASSEVWDCLDLTQPVALCLVSILHFIADDDDPYGIVRALLDALVPGSHFGASAGSCPPADGRRLDACEPCQYISMDLYSRPMNTIDPVSTAGLVAREVRTGSRDGTPTRIVIARRTYGTDQADLWDAVTSAERIPRWFLPISGDLTPGGRYQLDGNAGGVVERCAQPESFAVTWEFGDTVSWLDVTLTPTPDGTVLELAHEAPVDPAFWAQFGPGAVGVGWELGLLGLGLHLDSGASVDPAQAAAFTLSPDGVELVRRSAAGWADAAVGDGDEPGPAHEAAARTVSFYTTVPDDAAGSTAAPGPDGAESDASAGS